LTQSKNGSAPYQKEIRSSWMLSRAICSTIRNDHLMTSSYPGLPASSTLSHVSLGLKYIGPSRVVDNMVSRLYSLSATRGFDTTILERRGHKVTRLAHDFRRRRQPAGRRRTTCTCFQCRARLDARSQVRRIDALTLSRTKRSQTTIQIPIGILR
jgi:hypothetical protein